MIEVKKIHVREIEMPLREPFEISSGRVLNRRIMLLQVFDADGEHGWGECVAGEAPNYSPETIDGCWLALRKFVAPRLLGQPLAGPELMRETLDLDFRGNNMAKAALEMAVWELAARKDGEALAARLGGTRKTIDVGISLGIQPSPQQLAEKVQAALAAGYRKVKIKIKPGKDVAFLTAACAAAGNGARLMADANSAYTLDDLDRLREMDRFGLMMIEQPLAWDDLVQHRTLQRALKTPICLDESITGTDRARDMIELESGRIINIKPGRVGGLASAKDIHDLCARHNVPVWCGGMLESGIGRAHNVALASLANFTLPGDLSPSRRYWQQDIVIPEWVMDADGRVRVPLEKPGMGVDVDMQRVRKLTTREEILT